MLFTQSIIPNILFLIYYNKHRAKIIIEEFDANNPDIRFSDGGELKQNSMKESEILNKKIINFQSILHNYEGDELQSMEDYINDLKFLYEDTIARELEEAHEQSQTPPAPEDDDYEKQRQQEAKSDAEKADSGYEKSEPKFRKGQQVEAEGYEQPLIVLAFANKNGEIMLILLTAGGDKVEMSQGSVIIFGIYLGKPDDDEVEKGEADFHVFALQLGSGQGGSDTVDLPPEDYKQDNEQQGGGGNEQNTEQPQLPEKGSPDAEGFDPADIKGGFGFARGGKIQPKFKMGEEIFYIAPIDGDEIFDYIKKVDDKYYYISQGWLYKNCEKVRDNLFKIKITDGNKLFRKRSASKKSAGGSISESLKGSQATLYKPYQGYKRIQLIEKKGYKWLATIIGSGKLIEVYEDEFELD